ncbi:MAG: hypothetical protein AAGA54_19495 [Myxococcota bacterium]
MRNRAGGLGLAALLCACGADAGPQWSSCEEARASAVLFEMPEVALAGPVEVGDELPILRRAADVADGEELATQALALACVLTEDQVRARPALVDWAEDQLRGARTSSTGAFDREVSLALGGGTSPTLTARTDITARPRLDPEESEARARDRIEALRDDALVVGGDPDDIELRYAEIHGVTVDGDPHTADVLQRVEWVPRLGYVGLGVRPVNVGLENNGYVAWISVPLVRLYDDGERTTAEVAESEAEALFLDKVRERQGLEVRPEQAEWALSVPMEAPGEPLEVMFGGTTETTQIPVRPVSYYMSMSDRDAPLILP